MLLMRLGFVARSLAHPELRSHDGRRWQNGPHLSVSLAYLRDTLLYVARSHIGMYRMSSELAPYVTHPDMPQFHRQVAECQRELAAVGQLARSCEIRLSFHAGQHVVLNSPDPTVAAHSAADVLSQAEILDAMDLGPEAVIVTHLGGLYDDAVGARARFISCFLTLPEPVRRRLAIENDDSRYGVVDTVWVHQETGLRVVFDALHHRLHCPDGSDPLVALAQCLATWPVGVRPKIHYSTPRTEMTITRTPGSTAPQVHRPQWRNHADYVNPFEFIDFLRLAGSQPSFDVMLEVKARDLALLQLRDDLVSFAPDLAACEERPAANL